MAVPYTRGMKTTLPLLAALALAGCASPPSPATLSDGRQGFKVQCNGTARDWSDCYEAARQVCPAGFVADSRDDSTVGAVKITPTVYGAMVNRTLLFVCK